MPSRRLGRGVRTSPRVPPNLPGRLRENSAKLSLLCSQIRVWPSAWHGYSPYQASLDRIIENLPLFCQMLLIIFSARIQPAGESSKCLLPARETTRAVSEDRSGFKSFAFVGINRYVLSPQREDLRRRATRRESVVSRASFSPLARQNNGRKPPDIPPKESDVS